MNLSRAAGLAVIVFAVCACTPSVERAKGTSRGYHSARFVATKVSEKMPSGEMQDDPALHAEVKAAITREFTRHGVPVGRSGSEELIIAYMVLSQNTVSTTLNRDYFGNGRDAMAILDEAHRMGVINNRTPDDFHRGAILIDVLDAKTNKLVFRNYAVRPVTGGDAAEGQRKINSAVAQALEPFFRQ